MPEIPLLRRAALEYWALSRASNRGNREGINRHNAFFENDISEVVHRVFDERIYKVVKMGHGKADYVDFWGKVRGKTNQNNGYF